MNIQIKALENKSIWEEFANKYAPQSLFQSWNWGEVVRKGQNTSFRIGLYEDDNLVGIAQVVAIEAKKGRFLHIRHGPILKDYKEEYLKDLIIFLKQKAKEYNALYVRISPLIENSKTNNILFKNLGFHDSPLHALDGEYVWVLSIDNPEEELLANMRKTTRYLIRKAQKMGVIVEKSDNINQFLDLYSATSRRHGFVEHKGIREEFDVFSQNNQVALFLAKYQGQIVAAALILFSGIQAIYHHGASITTDIPGSYLLQWEAIREAKKRGLKYYNFRGIAPENKPNHPWHGLTLFKTGFGGKVKDYLHAQDLSFSLLYYFTYIAESLRKAKRGY